MNDNKELVILAGKGGGGGGGSGTDENAVHYTADTGKSDAEKAAARTNIGAEPEKLVVTITGNNGVYSSDATYSQCTQALSNGREIQFVLTPASGLDIRSESYVVIAGYIKICFVDTTTNDIRVNVVKIMVTGTVTMESVKMAEKPAVVTENSATPSITPEANTVYKCGELTSLTITNPPATGRYVIIFTSGATATTTTIPSTIKGLESFAAEANTRYEIDVEDNYAVVGHWAVSA